MSRGNRDEIEQTVERLIDEVRSRSGVTAGEHRFGGTEWRVGPREIGHIHAWGMLHVAYLRAPLPERSTTAADMHRLC